MTTNVEEIIKLVCPLCEKPLANEEYHKALQKLEIQAKEKSEKDEKTREIIHVKELEDMRIQTEQNVKQYYDEKLRNNEKEKEDQRKMFEEIMLQKDEQIKLMRNEQIMYKERYEKEADKKFGDEISRLTNIIKENASTENPVFSIEEIHDRQS